MGKRSREKQTKKREDWVRGILPKGTTEVRITVDEGTAAVELHGAEPGSMQTGRSFTTERGKEKFVVKVPSDKATAKWSPWSSIVEQFDHAIAVDTNYKPVAGRMMCATIAYAVDGHLKSYPSREWPFSFLTGFVFFDVPKGVNPEAVGWHLLFTMTDLPQIKRTDRVAIITDSELGKLEAINARSTPYYAGHLLPLNASLIHASDNDSLVMPNMMIRYCHRVASSVLTQLAARAGIAGEPSEDGNYSGLVRLFPNQPRPA